MTQIRKNIVGYNNLYQVSNMKYTVYIIRHISTWQVLYVGKTSNFKRRAYQHLHLNTGTKEWLSSIGTGNVLIEEVAEFNNEVDALKYEDELILKYGTIENGYNKNRSGLIRIENINKYNRELYQKNNKYREYQRTEKFKEKRREYSKTEKYRVYQKDYKKAKKIGLTIDEYRKMKIDQGVTLEQNKNQPIQLTINF